MTSTPFRVAYVDHACDIGGGAQEALLDILRYADRRIVQPVLLHAEGAQWLRDVDLNTLETRVVFPAAEAFPGQSRDDLGSLWRRASGAAQSLQPVRRIRRALAECRVDIVHTNTLKCHILGGLAARLAGKPLIWDVRDILEAGAARSVLLAVAKRTRPHVVAMSSAVADSLASARCETTVVLGARPLDKYSPDAPDDQLRAAIGIEPTDKVLSVIARLTPWKGHTTLLEAFASVLPQEPAARLLVIGDTGFWESDYRDTLERLAEQLGCADAVRWLGFREDITELLALTDVVVLPSHNEPFGLVLIEAMAANKPVIATNTAGPLEIVASGATGLLVEHGDARQLADAMLELLGDPDRARTMGQAGRKRAEKLFDISRLMQQLYGVYETLTS